MSIDAPVLLEDEQDAAELRLGDALASDSERRASAGAPDPVGPAGAGDAHDGDGQPHDETLLSPTSVSLAALLSSAAAGIACAGVFPGLLPRLVAAAAAVIGAGMIWLSTRVRRPSTVQFLTPVAAVLAGALLVLPDATGGSANLPGLVAEALREGGIGQPPVPFDPGWRFLLVVGVAMLAAAAAGLGTGLNRAKLAVFTPLPVVLGGLVAQSESGGMTTTIVALALVVAALTVSFGAELGREGATSGGFELRRFAKGGVALLALVVALAALTRVGALFPEPDDDQVVPPRRPPASPPEPDRELFTVEADRRIPWRVGVLDGYDGEAWLTPPYDTGRFTETGRGAVPGAVPARPGSVQEGESETVRVTFTITDVRGHVVPAPPNPSAVVGDVKVEYDPRTQTLRLPASRAEKGMRYTVEAPNPPHGTDLAGAPKPPESMGEYLDAPAPPPEVVDLLNQAPDADDFTRLQFVRQKFYEVVVAQGTGQPEEVPPARVAELLAGTPGTPFEITAAEALLARWVGVPSRIGFGYNGGDERPGGVVSIRPRHAGTWLEAYFEGYGWVAIVGTPPRAQASLNRSEKNPNAAVRPTDELTLPAYVPVRVPTAQLAYVLARYWVGRTVPYALAALLAVWLYPGVLKAFRRVRRRRWAVRGEPADRMRIAYAHLRDTASDFNVGRNSLTPLEFTALFEDDVEHRELAWLVTRALWGDLARDLKEEDVAAAEDMAKSVTARLKSVQPVTARALAFASRASLRSPFSDDMPNLWWPTPSLRSRARRGLARAARRALRLARLPRRAAARPATAALLVALFAAASAGCVRDVDVRGAASSPLPASLVPDSMGGLTFVREESGEDVFASAGPDRLVGDVRVFSVRRGGEVLGAVQIAALKDTLESRRGEVRSGILEALGGGRMELTRLGRDSVYREKLVDRQLFLWFSPEGGHYEVFVARNDFEDAGQVFAGLLAFQRGEQAEHVAPGAVDPRRGFEG